MITILPNWHPIFVHFTVALLIITAIMHVLSHFVSHGGLRNQLTITARWNLWIGIGFTVITVATGWVAFYTVGHDAPSHLAMIEHRNWAMVTFAVFLGIAAWEVFLHRHGKGKSWLFTALLALAASLLLFTAWHGGELVYRYGLGVMSMPKPEGAGHAHDQIDMMPDQDDITNDHPGMSEDSEDMDHDHDELPASAPSPHSESLPHKH